MTTHGGVLEREMDRFLRRLGITGQAAAVLMILFGILILAFPELVAFLIGLYLVVVGVLQLVGSMESRPADDPPSRVPGQGGARERDA